MSSNRLVSSTLNRETQPTASNFAGIAGDDGVCALFTNTSQRGSGTTFDGRGEDRLAEFNRIGQKLHDTLRRGFLTRLSSLMELLDRVLDQGGFAMQGVPSPAERITSLADALAGVPNDGNLPSAGFRVVVCGRVRELKSWLRDEVYRIGREAIVNACRHSQARHIEAEVDYRATGLRVTVRDNGRGVDSQELRWGPDGHWGLQGMREGAERIGARLRVSSRVGHGTEVELWVPGLVAFEQPAGRAVS